VGLDNLYVFVDILIAHLLLLFKWYIHAHNSTSPCGISFATRLQYDRAFVSFTSSRALEGQRARARAKICTKWPEGSKNRRRAVDTSAVTSSTAAATAAAASTLKYTRQRLSVEMHQSLYTVLCCGRV
jgi:hypothetical protein